MKNIFRCIFAIAAIGAASSISLADTLPVINGCVLSSDIPAFEKGIYTIGATPVLVAEGPDATCGGTLAGDVYVTAHRERQSFKTVPVVVVYNADTWEVEWKLENDVPYGMLASDIDYDSTTGKVYGSYYNDTGSGYVWGTADYATATREAIATLPDQYMAVACDETGQFYAISKSGVLLKVDKLTGATTEIGATGLKSSYASSGVIPKGSDKMYCTVSSSSQYAFYAVALTDGTAELIQTFANSEEIAGLYTPFIPAGAAPGEITDFQVSFPEGALTGTLSFTIPAETADGGEATGTVRYTVLQNGEECCSGEGVVGESVSVALTVAERGMYKYNVTLSNAAGKGKSVNTSLFVGLGMPAAPEPSATLDDDHITITWLPVTATTDGGYLNPDAIRYTVVRNDGLTLAECDALTTSVTDTAIDPEGSPVSYSYTVTAHNGDLTSQPATTQSVTVGKISAPFATGFDSPGEFAQFTVIDSNADGKTWQLSSGTATLDYHAKNDADDWLITPGIKLNAGKIYTISLKAWCGMARYPEKYEVRMGTAPTADGMTVELVAPHEVKTGGTEPETVSAQTYVETTGTYYFGIHGISDANQYKLVIDDFEVDKGMSTAVPGPVTDVAITTSGEGNLTAEISLKAPDCDALGGAVDELLSVTVVRNGRDEPVKVFENPAPGETLTLVDRAETAGEYTYTFVATNVNGKSVDVSESVYLGFGKPLSPENLKVTESDGNPGELTLSWTAVAEDVNGVVLSPEKVSYTIQSVMTGDVVVSGHPEAAYTFQAVEPGAQELVMYMVYATTEGGDSNAAYTALMAAGTPYDAPYELSFGAGEMAVNVFGANATTGCTWNTASDEEIGLKAANGDNASLVLLAYYKDEEATAFTGIVKVDPAMESPKFSMYSYNYDCIDDNDNPVKNENRVTVSVKADGELTPQLSYVVGELPVAEGWNKVSVDLAPYKGKNVQIYLDVTAVNGPTTIFDHFAIGNSYASDLTAVELKTPLKVRAGQEFDIYAKVTNSGSEAVAASDWNVDFFSDGVRLGAADGVALYPGETCYVGYQLETDAVTPQKQVYHAEISCRNDGNDGDNTTAAAEVVIEPTGYPVPGNLTGAMAGGNVNLGWSMPDMDSFDVEQVTETFEDAEEMPHGWSVDSSRGFYLHDASAEAMPTDARSGVRCLASGPAVKGGMVISPELSGREQIVSFYARSVYGGASLTVLYSPEDGQASAFTEVSTVNSVPAEWTRQVFVVPADAKRFAIRNNSTGNEELMIDDVVFEAKAMPLKLTGYKVYADGRNLMAEIPSETTACLLQPEAAGTTLAVSAVYDRGESALSGSIVVSESGVEAISVGGGVEVECLNGVVYLRNLGGKHVAICTTAGQIVYQTSNRDGAEVALAAGVYIISVDSEVTKIQVR